MRAPRSSRFLILAALLLGFVPSPARAQAPGGFSDFFVLGQDEHVWNMMNRVRSGEGAAAFPTPNRLNSVSSATATADGQRITYDHWEDGLEADITAPVQTSTLVFGDSNNANGRVCDYSVDPRVFPCTGVATHDDALYAGTPMSLASDQGMTGPCAAPYAAPPSLAQIRCSFPISPVVASITQAAGIATVTVTDPTGHSFANGSTVRVAGANEAGYNGSFTITTAGPASLTFTYAVPPATPSPATGTITVSFPTIRFDGGDRVFSTGGALPIAQIQDPGTPLIGGGTELLARELVKNATSYSVPVGEDLYPGANSAYFSVKYEAIDVVAFDDNTSVTVTSPGGTGGVRSFVLHRGQHYTSCATFGPGVAGNGAGAAPGACLSGAIDGPPPPGGPDNRGVSPALALTINAGTKIATDGPLNALIFTGGAGAYQTRHYATLPDILHTTDYVTTAPGDSAAGPAAPGTPATSNLNLFIYNPNPTTSINVTTTDTLGTTVITIPANSVADYRNSVGRFVPADSGVRLQSTRPFWGLSSYDSLATARDWGHAWLGVRFLKNDYTVAYSPGTQATPVDTFSLTAGCVATITTGTSHFLGQLGNNSIVRVSGVSNAQFNGVFTLTNAAVANAISYNIPACTGAPIAATVSTGTVVGVCDTTAVPTCNSYNRDPIWVAGTQNNTQVKIDLDADGLWDFVDINSDNCPDNGDLAAPAGTCENNVASVPAGCAALTANQCVYLVNAPGSASRNVLRVWDHTDQTNAGTRIVGTAPIALSWGEDTDQGQGADPSPDNGYTVYPPIGIDLVLGIEKDVSPLRVPVAGGAANYTVRIFAGDYGPLTFVLPRDTLPVGITCANYQSGSTVITYPDLTTSTADPSCAVLPGGRSQLTWAPVNTTLFTSEQMLINYTVNIPAAPGGLPRTLENEAQVTGNLGGSIFNPKDTAILTQADLTITKSVADDGVPEVGDVLTYTVTVTNNNVAAETNVVLTDIIPPFTTYVPGSATISTSLVKTVTSITKPANPATTATVTFANPQGALDRLTVSGATGGTIAYNGTFTPANLALTGIAFAGATATATTATAHGWANGDIIQIAGATDPLYNGRFTIAAVTATTFQYTMSGTPGAPSPAGPTATQRSANKFSYTVPAATPSPATGTIIASGTGFDAGQNAVVWSGDTFAALAVATVTFQVRITDSTPTGSIIANTANYSSTQIQSQNSNTVQTTVIGPILGLAKAITSVRTVSVTSLSDGGTSTATATSAAHGFTVGQFVTIAGATATAPNNYNGTFLVATVPNANTFTYTESAASGSVAGGVITATTAVTPGSVLDYEVLLSNSGTGGAKAVGISDNLAGTNTTYMAGTASFSVNGGPFTALTDAADADRFFVSGTALSFSYFRPITTVPVPGPGITRVGNVATVTTAVPHFFANGNTVTIAGADDILYDGTFVIAGVTATTFTYTMAGTPVVSPATGTVTAELNPTFSLPPGGTLRLRFKARVDPGTVGLYATNQARAVATGQPITPSNLTQVPIVRPTVVSIAKTSSGAGIVLPGQTLTYTVVVANDTGTTQTGITINDPLPAGTTYVLGSASVTTALPVFRSTEYYVAPGVFTLATFQLTLNQALATNYFVITQGSDLNGGADAPPSRTYISLTGDPFGTGTGGAVAGLANTGVANRIDFTRGAASLAGSSWSGVITVVECLNACTTAGFQLRDVARIAHPLATVGPTPVLSDFQWAGLGQIMLLGGFQGAGCDTAEVQAQDTKGCHVRLFPSGVSPAANINWTRDGGGAASLTASTSTVMVLEWGTQWTVNRRNITGGSGGAGIDAAGEYDPSAAFPGSPPGVARARTWVWGTGHTNNNEQQNASEGVALTLGNGVVQNANETIMSAGMFNGQTKSFEVYALTHPSLVVDHRFKPQNTASDPTTAVFDQTTSLGSGSRMALSYMGVDMNDNAYPQSMFSARYLSPAQIRLERRRTGGSFAAWTQGINFSNLSSTTGPVAPGHLPPGLVIPADGFTIPPGGTLTLTYQVLVDSPLSGAITQIANTATYTSAQVLAPGISSTAIDTVARPAVKVEPNNAGFVPFNAGTAQTILFTQGVTNLGTTADSFTLTLRNDILGWKLELIDPATGVVIATDTNGDGVWDGGVTISTGSLAVNQTKSYTIRATVPAGTPIGTQSSVELTATSALVPTVKDVGTDEITVLDVTKFGPVVLLPDHSGIVTAGQSIAYTHRIFNNTGSPEIFDLVVAGTGVGWTRTVHVDTNGDGVYTAGIDIAVANTANLPNGGSQILFVVVTAPLGETPGQNDLTDLTARSQTVPTQVDSVTDTTTILSATSHDLTGGGTRMVAVGDTATFPGTLYNLTATPDRFDIKIAAASLFGVDGLNHPSVLRVDTNADGISDTTIAIDTNGDGVWDSLCGSGAPPLPCSAATFNSDGDAFPDVLVAGNGALNYELVRVIDPAQAIWKEYVTLSATSFSTGRDRRGDGAVDHRRPEPGLDPRPARGSFRRGGIRHRHPARHEVRSTSIETNERSREGERTLLNASPVLSPGPDSAVPILYRVETDPDQGPIPADRRDGDVRHGPDLRTLFDDQYPPASRPREGRGPDGCGRGACGPRPSRPP